MWVINKVFYFSLDRHFVQYLESFQSNMETLEAFHTHQTQHRPPHPASDRSVDLVFGGSPLPFIAIMTNSPPPRPRAAAALYSQRDSHRLRSWCRAWLICPWTFILCILHLRRRRRAPRASVCSVLCCRSLPHNPHRQPEKQIYFWSFEHKTTMSEYLLFCCLLLLITGPPRGPPELSRGSKKAEVRPMLSCFQPQCR